MKLLQKISAVLLKWGGWTVSVATPDYPKCIICVAPHTSNWDFILCELAITSIGRHSGFLMKASWFFWPLGAFFRSIGGIAVAHKPGVSLTQQLIDKFNSSERLVIAVTPEGTRSRTDKWRTGFLQVAYATKVPVTLASVDFRTRQIQMLTTFNPTGDVDADMRAIKDYYKNCTGLYPEKFSTE